MIHGPVDLIYITVRKFGARKRSLLDISRLAKRACVVISPREVSRASAGAEDPFPIYPDVRRDRQRDSGLGQMALHHARLFSSNRRPSRSSHRFRQKR